MCNVPIVASARLGVANQVSPELLQTVMMCRLLSAEDLSKSACSGFPEVWANESKRSERLLR